ncbi:hypothetical protein NW995_002450 [Salmonella enterica]|nr:hypothetical protein [Salmonella enterica]
MEWKEINRRYGTNPEYLYLNKLHVATVGWDDGRSKNSPHTHSADVHLPGMKKEFTYSTHSSKQAAKEYAEAVVKRWIDAAGLEFK